MLGTLAGRTPALEGKRILGMAAVHAEHVLLASGHKVCVLTAADSSDDSAAAGRGADTGYATATEASSDDGYATGSEAYTAGSAYVIPGGSGIDAAGARRAPTRSAVMDGVPNKRASVIASHPVYGDALVVFGASAPQSMMYQLMRPEAVRASATRLSSDAFGPLGFGPNATDQREVREACAQMLARLPSVAAELEQLETSTAGLWARLALLRSWVETSPTHLWQYKRVLEYLSRYGIR